MSLAAGSKLGQYEIVSPLGAGGMGEVYRAKDKRLGRDVALKVLPEAFANDAQRMVRFEREAKVLASLSHPNIAMLHGFEESNGTRALEIYVQPFPATGGKWMISTEGGIYPLWARNGREIFFRIEDKIMSVPIETQPGFKAGTPRMLFRGGGSLGGGSYMRTESYDVSPDGQHFLMIKEKQAPGSSKEVSIVVHWTDLLKHIAPAARK